MEDTMFSSFFLSEFYTIFCKLKQTKEIHKMRYFYRNDLEYAGSITFGEIYTWLRRSNGNDADVFHVHSYI